MPQIWQHKCKVVVRQAFVGFIARDIKSNNKSFFECIRSRKLFREPIGQLNNKGMKGLLKEGREIAEKLNEFYASLVTVENIRNDWNRWILI